MKTPPRRAKRLPPEGERDRRDRAQEWPVGERAQEWKRRRWREAPPDSKVKMSFLPDIVKKGWTEEEVFGICFESERERNRRRLQAIVCDHHLKQVEEFLLYNELAIWRRENGFDRVMEGEESCFPGHRSLPPTPQEYYASVWCVEYPRHGYVLYG